MKKTLFPVLVAALVMTACGTKTTEQTAQTAQTETTARVGASDIAYVQVEAVLAQCDLFLTEGKALQEKTEKAQKSWVQREQNLQAEVAQLQEKFQKGLITSRDAQAQQESRNGRHPIRTTPRRRPSRSTRRTTSSRTGRRTCSTAPCSRSTPTGSTSSSSTPRRSSTPIRRSTSRPPCCRRSMSCTPPTKRPRRSKTAGQKAKKRFPRQRGSRFFHTFAGKLTTD